jgi:hypothetical protein
VEGIGCYRLIRLQVEEVERCEVGSPWKKVIATPGPAVPSSVDIDMYLLSKDVNHDLLPLDDRFC